MTRAVEILTRHSDDLPPWCGRKIEPRESQQAAVAAVREWLRTLGTRDRPGLFLHGPTGTGKTLCAGRAAYWLRERGTPVLYLKAKRLLDDLRRFDTPPSDTPWAADTPDRVRERIHTATVLVVDDLGAHRATDYALEELCAVFDRRHDFKLPTLITSNLAGAQLAERLDSRIASRIAGHCIAVRIDGADQRFTTHASHPAA